MLPPPPDPVKVFYHSLTQQIDDLESMLHTDNHNVMSIQFLERVLSVTRFCHSQMTHCAQALKLPTAGSWFDKYMAESETLMKACEDIRVGVKNMEHYYFLAFAVTDNLEDKPVLSPLDVEEMISLIGICTKAAEEVEDHNTRLSTKWSHLRDVEPVFSEESLHGFDGVLYATRSVCKTLLRILMHGLVYCCQQYRFDRYVHRGTPFMVSKDKLQESVESDISKLTRRTGIIWYEFRQSMVYMPELLTMFERVPKGVGVVDQEIDGSIHELGTKMKPYVAALMEGSERIIEQINGFTDAITVERNKISGLA